MSSRISDLRKKSIELAEEKKSLGDQFDSLSFDLGIIKELAAGLSDEEVLESISSHEKILNSEKKQTSDDIEGNTDRREEKIQETDSYIESLEDNLGKLEQMNNVSDLRRNDNSAKRTEKRIGELQEIKALLEGEIDVVSNGSMEEVNQENSGISIEEMFLTFEDKINVFSVEKKDDKLDLLSHQNKYTTIIKSLQSTNVEYRPIVLAPQKRTHEEIVSRLSGGDLTEGSCSSLALAYIGNVGGYDVLDFRDGASRIYFSTRSSIEEIGMLEGVVSEKVSGKNDFESANNLLNRIESGKEYYLAIGEHAAIVRKNGDYFEYLELQHPGSRNGWNYLDDYVLLKRFGCSESHTVPYTNYLMEVDSLKNHQEFLNILGYINTAEMAQRKGENGNVR